MLTHILFLFLIFFAKAQNLPETKHLDGGIFGWANALALQRKLWSFLPFPVIRFDKEDINMAKITKEIISGRIDLNLSQIIQDMLTSLQDNLNSDNETSDSSNEEYSKILNKEKFTEYAHIYGKKKVLEDEEQPIDENPKQCSEDEYPNAYLVSKFIGDDLFKDIDCKVIDDSIGQILSYIFVIAPLLIITVFCTLFYIVFLFGRCCCCKAKDRSSPGACAIVIFVIVLIGMVVSLCFSIASSTFIYKVVDYVFSKKVLDEATAACNLINPSLNEGLSKVVDEIIPAISDISNQSIQTIDNSLPQLMDVFNSASDNISSISSVITNLSQYGQQSSANCVASEDQFNTCLEENNPKLQGECQNTKLPNLTLISSYTDFDSISQISNDLNSYLSNITEIMDITSFIDEGKDKLVDMINTIQDQVLKLDNVTVVNKCDFQSTLDFVDNLPSFLIPALKAALFLIPLFMLILIVFEIIAFTTKNCCSRCLSACCVPCCICTFCQFLFGLFTTIMLIFLIMVNIFASQGDDVFDTFLKEVTNDDKVIDFGHLNLSSVTNGVIGTFPLDQIMLKKVNFIGNFLSADLDSKLSTILSTSELPFDDIATLLENAMNRASETTNLDSLIVGPINEMINETKMSLPDSELSDIANTTEMELVLTSYEDPVNRCYKMCDPQFSELSKSYSQFFSNFNSLRIEFAQTKEKIEPVLDAVPGNVSSLSNSLFGGLLKSMGKTVAKTFRLIVPVLDNIDVKWLIGAFNIIRVRFCYNLFAAVVCTSIAAHLFIVSMTAMSLVVWVRRKGMSDKGQVENSNDEDSDLDSDSLSSMSSSSKAEKNKKSSAFSRKQKVSNDDSA